EPLFGGRLARGLVEPRLEQFPLEIGLGPGGARRLEIAPGPFRRALRLRQRPGALRPSEVREHIGHLALVQRQLVAQRRQLAFEHRHPLAMLGREPPGDRHRLGVADLGRQAPAPPRRASPARTAWPPPPPRACDAPGPAPPPAASPERARRAARPAGARTRAASSCEPSSQRTARTPAPPRAICTWGRRAAGARAPRWPAAG